MAEAKTTTTDKPALKEERLEEALKVEKGNDAVLLQSPQMLVNTTESMKVVKTNADLAKETKAAQKKFGDAKKEKVSIPTVLVPKLGNVQFISINGVSVNVPVDGEDHEIPKPHADFLKQYIKELQ